MRRYDIIMCGGLGEEAVLSVFLDEATGQQLVMRRADGTICVCECKAKVSISTKTKTNTTDEEKHLVKSSILCELNFGFKYADVLRLVEGEKN